MDSKPQFSNQQKYRKFISKNDLSFKTYSSSSFQNAYTSQTSFQNPLRSNNEMNSTSADSYSYQNSNPNYEKPKIKDNVIILRPNEFVAELFRNFSEKDSLCNFSLFVKNVDIEMNLEEKVLKKITLNEYFESFIEGSFQCLNIPFLDKKGNLSYNIFNPTLSSMNLVIHKNRIKNKNINQKYLEPNFSADLTNDNLIKIEFDETNPPYNREIIEKKIKIIHKLLGVKDIFLDDIDKEKSFFSILWTPADTYKIKSSFLSVYTFDFKLVGTLIIKLDEYNWFTIYSNNTNYMGFKDFKSEYVNNVNEVENFMKKSKGINDEEKLDRKLFSQDYKRFIYNY
jgi:hypothetical protein